MRLQPLFFILLRPFLLTACEYELDSSYLTVTTHYGVREIKSAGE